MILYHTISHVDSAQDYSGSSCVPCVSFGREIGDIMVIS